MADINYVKVGGRMHSTSEDNNPANNHITTGANEVFDDSLNMRQDQVNALIINNDRHVTVVANESTTSIYELLPATGEDNIIYRVAMWDGSQYDPSKYAEYGWNDNDYILLSVSEAAVDEEPTPGSPNPVSSNGVALVDGYYDKNPEYIRVYLDSEGKIIKGIKSDGKEYFGVGVETDASITASFENPEFLTVFNDNDGRIIWAIRRNGDIYYGVGVPSQIAEYVENLVRPLLELFVLENNPEFIEASVDPDGKISEATRINGTKVLPCGVETTKVDIDGVKVTNEYSPEYIDVKTDKDGKILEGHRLNGNKHFKVPVENDAAIVTSENAPAYFEVTTDEDGRLINSIDRELEDVRYGGINLSGFIIEKDNDTLEVGIDMNTCYIYTIENENSSITMEVDNDLNVYEVKNTSNPASLLMLEGGEVYIEQTIKEI